MPEDLVFTNEKITIIANVIKGILLTISPESIGVCVEGFRDLLILMDDAVKFFKTEETEKIIDGVRNIFKITNTVEDKINLCKEVGDDFKGVG